MEIEVKRKVKKEVEETVVMELQKHYVVRVIKVYAGNTKTCVHEVDFGIEKPNEQGIADAIMQAKEKYKASADLFAVVAEKYVFVEKEN